LYRFCLVKFTVYLRYTYLYIILYTCQVMAQDIENIGVPLIVNYDTKSLGFNSQTWSMAQDNEGVLYFANGQNIITYNGVEWDDIHESIGMVNRSLYVSKTDSLYVGMDGNYGSLGKISKSDYEYGLMHNFTSDATEDIEEFWNIHQVKESLIFQTFRNLYVHQGKLITKIPAPYRFRWSYRVNSDLYVNDIKYGVFKLSNTNLVPVVSDPKINAGIIGLTKLQDRLIIITENDGLFWLDNETLKPFTFPASQSIIKSKIFSFLKLKNGNLAIGTVTNGVYIINEEGKLVHHINKKKGLQNNTVLSLFEDQERNLWLGLDYGIDYVKLNSKISYKIDYLGDFGTVYSAVKHDNHLYVGSNQGFYVVDLKDSVSPENIDSEFNFKSLIKGQVWNISKIDNDILIGHDQGVFQYLDNKLVNLSFEPGAWNFKRLNSRKDILICGNYSGVSIYMKKGNKWTFFSKINGYEESGKFLEIDKDDNLWIVLRSRGVFKLNVDYDTGNIINSEFFDKNDLTDNASVGLTKIDDEVVITSGDFAKYYDERQKKFVTKRDVKTTPYSDRVIEYDNLQWILNNNEITVYNKLENTLTSINDINDRLVYELLDVIQLSKQHYLIPIYNGFAIYDNEKPVINVSLSNNEPLIYDIKSIDTGKNFKENAKIRYAENSLSINYAFPSFSEEVQYQTKLSSDENWTDWSTATSKNFINLPEGDYTFKVKHKYKDYEGLNAISFSIKPPLHRTLGAYVLYVLITIFTVLGLVKWNSYRLKSQEKKLLERRRISLNEQETKFKEQELIQKRRIVELENKNLQEEIRSKSRELAKVAHVNLNKNKVLKKIKDKVVSVQENATDKLSERGYKEILRQIDYYVTDKENKVFEINFDKSHQLFYERLTKKYESLTAKDLRLCAYLKMNLSSKEIAPLLGISPQSVDVSRHRLRKKMQLSSKDNLISILFDLD